MTGPYQIPRPILTALIALAALGSCLDYTIGAIPVQTLHIPQSQMVVISLVVAGLIAADREGGGLRRGRGRLAWALVLAVVGIGAALGLHEWLHRLKMREALAAVCLTGAALWLAAPLLTRRRLDGSARGPWLPWGMGLLLAYLLICLATGLAGIRPQYSINVYTMERALPVALIAGWARAAERDEKFLRDSGLAVLAILGALLLVAAAINFLDLTGADTLRAKFVAWRLVFAKAENATWDIPRRRIQFPMLHFNRSAYWAMIVMMTMLVAARWGRQAPWRRRAALALAALAFWIVTQTYTRGVGVAAIAGAIVWVATISRRTLIATAVLSAMGAAAVVVLLLAGGGRTPPGANQPQTRTAAYIAQMRTVFDPETYKVNEPPLTSMKTRLMAWMWSVRSIAAHPVGGLGYGRGIVQDAYEKYVFAQGTPAARQSLSGNDEMRHVHNLWLETMAESGIPAGVTLLGFCIARWAALIALWRRGPGCTRGVAGAWLAAEAAVFVAGMNFYMVKQNFGMLTLLVWAYALVWAAAAWDRPPSAERI